MLVAKLRNLRLISLRFFNLIKYKIKSKLLWERYYKFLREPKLKGGIKHTVLEIQNEIIKELKNNNFHVIDYVIDLVDYERFLKRAEYNKFPKYLGGGKSKIFVEKSLEHYLAAKFLELSNNDIYIDIANNNAPPPDIYQKLYKCKVYRQDLIFRKGVRGNIIGGDACSLPLMNGFASKMALHCSFEHFEQDTDIKFIKEANRVLKKGGRLCILPLYLFNKYAIQTDLGAIPKRKYRFEEDAIIYCVKGNRIRHGRCYDIPHLINRIRDHLNDLKLTIYVIQNEKEVAPSCYVKFIALFEKSN